MSTETDVLIIGGGIAGLVAARDLSAAGLRVILLEARDRLGGRILTYKKSSFPMELGAEFIHGSGPETLELAAAFATKLVAVEGAFRRRSQGKWMDAWELMQEVDKLFSEMPATGPDLPFSEYLDRSGAKEQVKKQARAYVEGFHAADPSRVSVQWIRRGADAEEEIEGNRQFRFLEGHSTLVEALVAEHKLYTGLIVHCSTAVREISWQSGSVVARTESAEYTAPKAIITLPVGVLKSGPIKFSPSLAEKSGALARIEMGPVLRVALCFKERLWEGRPGFEGLAFMFTDVARFPTWWTVNPLPWPMLVGWSAGPNTADLSGMNEEQVIEAAAEALGNVLLDHGLVRSQLVMGMVHDWQRDEYSRGAYSYATVGGADAAAEFARPLMKTLYFAGEATDIHNRTGTVEGAISSAHRAAKEILSANLKTN